MTCNGKTYIPEPPRLWSRVENVLFPESSDRYNNYLMAKKGNVLQHRSNSSLFTKKQIYSLMAQKKWTNRNATWATQNSRGYTNPNTRMLKRNNTTNIIISSPTFVETTLPITCPSIPNLNNDSLPDNLPDQSGNEGQNLELPPTESETGENGNSLPLTPNEYDNTPIIISDLGTLLCNIVENPCTSYTEVKQSNQMYHPTTDSDVPGKINLLYWNETIQPWYPRQRLNMSTSSNKWPYTTGPPTDPTYRAATSYDL